MTRGQTVLRIADPDDREEIYRIRHDVYAAELGQHATNPDGRLSDRLDAVNVYLVATRGQVVVGFVAITPPNALGYSIDKYFARAEVPVAFDEGLFEIRLLTVVPSARRTLLAFRLMHGALRWCAARGARTIVAIGRVELLNLYQRVGLRALGRRVTSGAVVYELMAATTAEFRESADRLAPLVRREERDTGRHVADNDQMVDDGCYHGGAFFDAVGDEFDHLERAAGVISADVLDAWFAPAPSVVAAVAKHLSFALQTSPPTGCDGLRRVIARFRGVDVDNILPGAGSSDLIFAGFRTWLTRESRVLILDPMYGEYAHVLETVIGARVDRLTLAREADYDVDESALRAALGRGYDWVVLVNPNSPTGRYLSGRALTNILCDAPPTTRIWVDETYLEFAGGESLETFAADSRSVIVCKSMSKAYALSGARAGYLCGPAPLIQALRGVCPPWSVSLPGQIAACEALRAAEYYAERWQDTHELREDLSTGLRRLGIDVVPGCANFVLCRLPEQGPDAAALVRTARLRGLFLREVKAMGRTLGPYDFRVAVKDCATNQRMVAIIAAISKGR